MVLSVIFDLDGTLVDTAPDLVLAANHCLSPLGVPPLSKEVLRSWVGQGALALLRKAALFSGVNLTFDQEKTLHAEFLSFYGAHIAEESRVFPGVFPLLTQLQEAGYPIGVCTNKQESLARALLEALGISTYVGALVGGDTVGVAKPHPAPYFETLARLGQEGGKSVLIGDSEVDRHTAAAAGVPFIGVTFGYLASGKMADFSPEYCVDHMIDCWPIVRTLSMP